MARICARGGVKCDYNIGYNPLQGSPYISLHTQLVQLWLLLLLAVTPEFSFLLPMFTFNTAWENRRAVLMNKGERGDNKTE